MCSFDLYLGQLLLHLLENQASLLPTIILANFMSYFFKLSLDYLFQLFQLLYSPRSLFSIKFSLSSSVVFLTLGFKNLQEKYAPKRTHPLAVFECHLIDVSSRLVSHFADQNFLT